MNTKEPCINCRFLQYDCMAKNDPSSMSYCVKEQDTASEFCKFYRRDPHGYSEKSAIGDMVVRCDDGTKAGIVWAKVRRAIWLVRSVKHVDLQYAHEDTVKSICC